MPHDDNQGSGTVLTLGRVVLLQNSHLMPPDRRDTTKEALLLTLSVGSSARDGAAAAWATASAEAQQGRPARRPCLGSPPP